MNKNELIKGISKESKLSQKEAREALTALAKIIKESLKKGDNVKISGFGKFEVKNRKERVTTNPQTRQRLVIPATKVTSFKAGKELKNAISG